MAILRSILPWLLVGLLTAVPVHAGKRKPRVAKPMVMQPALAPKLPGIVSPLSPKQREQYDVDRAPRPLLPGSVDLSLRNGLSVMLDRSLRVRLDLATLWDKDIKQPNTYSLTLEAQSGMGWVWLTYRLPSSQLQPLAPLTLRGEERAEP